MYQIVYPLQNTQNDHTLFIGSVTNNNCSIFLTILVTYFLATVVR